MSTAVTPIDNSGLLTDYIKQSQDANNAAQSAMNNNVSNGVNASGSASATGVSSVAGNFNTFLKILTTQLKNQDPTSPMDTNQFTQELVQFSGVEQQINTNSLLQKLVDASGVGGVKALLGYVGQYVQVPANNQLLIQNGQSNLSYTLPAVAQKVTLTIKDSQGTTVATLPAPTTAGANNIVWDGKDSGGNQLPDGVYKLTIDAKDSGGNAITPTSVSIVGLVTGVQTADSSGNDLMMGPNMSVNDTSVTAVYSASSLATSTGNTGS